MEKLLNNMNEIQNELLQPRKRVALYLRLSKEDLVKIENKTDEEIRSESIYNQERMLRDKAEKEGWEVVGVYIDEDYSGIDTYVSRPEFDRLIKDCETGKIDIVLCKSQSRFSRDMEVIEKYLHNKFIEWNVRFIGLVDNADTENKGNKKQRQILGLTNEWYADEISENLKYTLRNKKSHGLYTGAFAPYGYIKDPEDKNHLIIDKVASEVVKEIFDLYKNGWGYAKIVNYLHEKEIPSPYDYKRKNGMPIASSVMQKWKTSIKKKGGYIVINTLRNCSLQNKSNLICLNTLEINNQSGISFSNQTKMKVRKLEDDMKFFYSTHVHNIKSIDITNENEWKELKEGEEIPNEMVSYIIVKNELRISKECFYEIEIQIETTSEKEEYSYKVETNYEDIKSTIEYQNKFYWSTNTISSILRNEMYIGNLVQGKYEHISVKKQKTRKVKKENWIIVPNVHEPIIDKKTWYEVQKRLNERKRCDTITGTVNPLSRKVICGVCGRTFEKTSGRGHRHEYMVCNDNRHCWRNCDNKNMIRLDYLTQDILHQLNQFIDTFKDNKLLDQENQELIYQNMYSKKLDTLHQELKKIKEVSHSKEIYFQQLYEDRVNKTITDSQFFSLLRKYNEDMETLKQREIAIKKEEDYLLMKQNEQKNTATLFEKYNHIETLTSTVVNEFIDKIVIGKLNQETGERDVKIIWNFNTI